MPYTYARKGKGKGKREISPEGKLKRAIFFAILMTVIALIVVTVKFAHGYEYVRATSDGYLMTTELTVTQVKGTEITVDYYGKPFTYVTTENAFEVGDKAVVTFSVTGTENDWYITSVE